MSVYSYIIKHTRSKRKRPTENIYIYNKELTVPVWFPPVNISVMLLQPTHIMANIQCVISSVPP